MRRRYLAIGAVLVGLFPGCSSGGHRSGAPPTTTTTAASPNPDVVPAVITPAYVDAVFRVLNHVYGNATRDLVKDKSVTASVKGDLQAIFSSSLYQQQVSEAEQSLQGPISNVKLDPGDAVTVVDRLLVGTQQCIFVETKTDLSSVLAHPTPAPAAEYYELRHQNAGSADLANINPTAWVITFNVDYLTAQSPPQRCAS